MKYNSNKLNARLADDDDSDGNSFGSLRMFNKPIILNSIDVYLDEPIGPLAYYRELLHYLRTMEEGDELRIWIDTEGGYLDSAMAIIDAMQNTKGDVVCIVQGSAKSAGGLIALGAPSLILGDNATFMCHTATYGPGVGKAGNINSSVQFSTKTIEAIVRKYYKDFLTQTEIDDMLSGKDFWFDVEEARDRLERRSELQKAEMDVLQKADDVAAEIAAEAVPVPRKPKK